MKKKEEKENDQTNCVAYAFMASFCHLFIEWLDKCGKF